MKEKMLEIRRGREVKFTPERIEQIRIWSSAASAARKSPN